MTFPTTVGIKADGAFCYPDKGFNGTYENCMHIFHLQSNHIGNEILFYYINANAKGYKNFGNEEEIEYMPLEKQDELFYHIITEYQRLIEEREDEGQSPKLN